MRSRLTGEQQYAIPETAHMLGRLYALLVCVALPADLAQALRRECGVPVLGDIDVLSSPGDPGTAVTSGDGVLDLRGGLCLQQWHVALADSFT